MRGVERAPPSAAYNVLSNSWNALTTEKKIDSLIIGRAVAA